MRVVATHGRSAWSGRLAFPLGGSDKWAGASVPYEVTVQPNIYTVAMAGGGLTGAAPRRVDPAASQLGRAGKTIMFTLEFPAR